MDATKRGGSSTSSLAEAQGRTMVASLTKSPGRTVIAPVKRTRVRSTPGGQHDQRVTAALALPLALASAVSWFGGEPIIARSRTPNRPRAFDESGL